MRTLVLAGHPPAVAVGAAAVPGPVDVVILAASIGSVVPVEAGVVTTVSAAAGILTGVEGAPP